MNDVQIDETFDGVFTVKVGNQLVFSDLSRDEAEALAARFRHEC